MKNDTQLDRYLQDFRLKLGFDEMTRLPFRIMTQKQTVQKQLELFTDAQLGPEPESADDDRADDEQAEKRAARDHDARRAIVLSALKAATTPAIRRRLHGGQALTVVVEVPSSDWVKGIEDYFNSIRSEDWVTFARDGSNKSRDKAGVGNSEAATKISAGRRVIGIAANPKVILPAVLQAAADVTIRIVQPTGATVRHALKRCYSRRVPGHIDDKLVAGLGLDDLVAAMRSGSTASQAIERMRAVSVGRGGAQRLDKFPALETAVEYGAAREWGLALARDLEDYRAGTLPWSAIDRGAIVHSPPGCGKSVLAGSLAQACKVPLVRASVAEYFAAGEGHLGDIVKAQRAVFDKAAAMAPCILFIDEIDAIPNRNTLSNRGADWWMPIINDFLLLLDGAVAGQREGVIVIGATNRIDAVEDAILRPGRLERSISIGRPGLAGIVNILRFHLGSDLAGEDLTEVARTAEGSTAAELMENVRGARRTARYAKRPLTLDDLQAQIRGEQDDPPAVLRRIAVHEAAHAVTTVVLSVGELLYVTLQTRGTSGGHTKVRSSDADLMTLSDVENRVISILSAGVAERLFLSSKSIGSGGTDTSDDGVATSMISVLYASTSLTGEFFHLCSSEEALATVRADPKLRDLVEQHLRRLEKRATDLVERYRECIDAVAKALAESRYLTGDEVIAVLQAADYLKLVSTEGAQAC
jgi:cell division protease FtsH